MEEKCKIVQDLLPNYIEKLTNEETNKFIEEHLNTCEECKKTYDNMKEKLGTEDNNEKSKQEENKKVKFLKKYRDKLRILEIIILIIVAAFVINTGRKAYIISSLSNKAEEYEILDNYHQVTYSLQEGTFHKAEVFSMEGKKKLVYTTITDEETSIVIMNLTQIENERYKGNIYIDKNSEKKVVLNKEIGVMVGPQDILKTENLGQLMVCSITSFIKSTTFDGIESYYISNFKGESGMYINKETGLPRSTMSGEIEYVDGMKGRTPVTEYKYEFGTVTEEDFTEPDISEYTVKEEI